MCMEGETGVRDSLEIKLWGAGEKADCPDDVAVVVVVVENNICKTNRDQRFAWTAKMLLFSFSPSLSIHEKCTYGLSVETELNFGNAYSVSEFNFD